MHQGIYEEMAREILKEGTDVQSAKTKICRKFSLAEVPGNAEILENVDAEKRRLLLPLLRRKPVRSISGVSVVAVMSSPEPCPHGKCLYCPTRKGAPQSYTGEEPAALRGSRSGFDPYRQVTDRLSQLQAIGHNIEKTDLIIMGGTFPARDPVYQEWFVKRCFDAMNSYEGMVPVESQNIEEAQSLNESAVVRNVGITFETRPDFARERQVDRIMELGGTRVELGVQTLRNDVYEKVGRGHTLEDVITSTRVIRDSGLKLCYHMMPGLFSSAAEDLGMFEELFSSPNYKPDMLKIYPTLVLEGTGLYELWRTGVFEPLSEEEIIDLLVVVKKRLPKWVRTMRIQRDIPAGLVAAGVKKGNLGEIVSKRLEEEGVRCRCIRCREAGHLEYKQRVRATDLEVMVEQYSASDGEEYFFSMEDESMDVVAGYLRMRFPSDRVHRTEVGNNTALIRELKVVGEALRIGEHCSQGKQHKGIGRELLERAEETARFAGMERMLVNSAAGTREYYRRLGYEREGAYMGKGL